MEFQFRIHATRADGTVNRRFHKARYTAALRFGVVLPAERGFVELSFQGSPAADVLGHGENKSYEGQLSLNGEHFPDVIVIARPRDSRRTDLITFWPKSQQPDAHQSYTDPLVDTAVDGTPFDIQIVATRMHAVFKLNAGASPATLMKLLYEEEAETLRAHAETLGRLLDESFSREREAGTALEEARTARAAAEAERLAAQNELNRLRRLAQVPEPFDKASRRLSDPVTLKAVTEGPRGKNNQPAVLLHMSDGSVRANNWERGYAARLKYAERLIGTVVRTDVWGPYSEREWFKNIYPDPTAVPTSQEDELPF